MAIQKINLGTEPLGEGGDTYRSANTKINENFTNTSHAASRLVGRAYGNLPELSYEGLAGSGWLHGGIPTKSLPECDSPTSMNTTMICRFTNSSADILNYKNVISLPYATGAYGTQLIMNISGSARAWLRVGSGTAANDTYLPPVEFYTTGNTTKDSKTNLLLASGNTIPNNSAASRLVGKVTGNVAEWHENFGVNETGWGGVAAHAPPSNTIRQGCINKVSAPSVGLPFSSWAGVASLNSDAAAGGYGVYLAWSQLDPSKVYLGGILGGVQQPWAKIYTDKNTQSDTSTNGYIKPSSPIIMLHTDSITTNDDGEKMGVEFTKKGVGDYEIKGTTGLRNEGWYIEIPNDLHGNPMVAVTLDEKDGTLNLKSFKRVFNMQTFKFEPDLESPMDIPEGRWIDLRFNDLPEDQLDEPEPEEEPIVDEEADPEVVEEEPSEEPVEESE